MHGGVGSSSILFSSWPSQSIETDRCNRRSDAGSGESLLPVRPGEDPLWDREVSEGDGQAVQVRRPRFHFLTDLVGWTS